MENREESLKRRIAEEIVRFEADQMSIRPEGIRVEILADKVLATLSGIACPAERELAKDRASRALLAEFHNGLFDAAKNSLEIAVAKITGRPVIRSGLSVDAGSGTGILTFSLGPENRENTSVDGIEERETE